VLDLIVLLLIAQGSCKSYKTPWLEVKWVNLKIRASID